MALSTTTVQGTIDFPSGSTPTRAVIRFRLTNVDASAPNIFVGQSEFPVASDGTFTAIIQATDNLDERTYYEVTLGYFDQAAGRDAVIGLGLVKVPDAAFPMNLASLLPVQAPAGASNVHRMKRGDTLSFGLVMLDQYGRRLDVTPFTIAASMRQGSAPATNFSVTVVDALVGRVDLTVSASTSSGLALGAHDFDIKLTNGVRVSRTLTGTIIVDPEVTP